MSQIIFYDIPNVASKLDARPWSPNTWKTRFALGFKGLSFKTVWVEYPDIARLCKQIGAAATATVDGTPHYTLPVIHDLSTGKIVSDSWAIALYLDATYPDRPLLMPRGTVGIQHAFEVAVPEITSAHYRKSIFHHVCEQLNPRSREYFRRTREAVWGCKLEELVVGQARIDGFKKAHEGFTRVKGWMEENGEGSQRIMGDTATYADLILASWLIWVRQVAPKDWETLLTWDGGFWGRFVKELEEKYVVYDEGEEYKA